MGAKSRWTNARPSIVSNDSGFDAGYGRVECLLRS
jgi:hypothetical protein